MSKKLWLFASILMSISTSSVFAKNNNESVLQQQQTQAFVDAKMNKTLSSIDQSLATLVTIERGGEGARKGQPIGATVAGEASPNRQAMQPDILTNAQLPKHLRAADPSVLDRKVQLHWNGSADSLLNDMAKQLGFSFSNGGRALTKRVYVEGDNLSVRDVLSLVANQIKKQADIHISLENKSIFVVLH